MKTSRSSLGHLKAKLAEPIGTIPDDLIEKLNSNCNPPEKLGADEVHIRAMYIVSDEVNSYGGKFPADEHEKLAELLIDSPVLVGHRQDKLPVGRNFHATLVERDGKHWIKCYFYWLVSAEGAQNLLKNIDGGVYKECSIGFSFRLPECSICGKDIRLCEHEPFQKYISSAGEVTCHFSYRQIEKVLETSLVYRGAIRNTSISNELSLSGMDRLEPVKLASLALADELESSQRYLIIPRYASINASLTIDGKKLRLNDSTGRTFKEAPLDSKSGKKVAEFEDLPVRVVGMRGKERCTLQQLSQYLIDSSGPVSRLALLVMPADQGDHSGITKPAIDVELKPMPHRIGVVAEIDRLASEVMTRDGVEIWQLDEAGDISDGRHYRPKQPAVSDPNRYSMVSGSGGHASSLIIKHQLLPEPIEVRAFKPESQYQSSRFLADSHSLSKKSDQLDHKFSIHGPVTGVVKKGTGWIIHLGGKLRGEYILRPAKLNNRKRWLFYRQSD